MTDETPCWAPWSRKWALLASLTLVATTTSGCLTFGPTYHYIESSFPEVSSQLLKPRVAKPVDVVVEYPFLSGSDPTMDIDTENAHIRAVLEQTRLFGAVTSFGGLDDRDNLRFEFRSGFIVTMECSATLLPLGGAPVTKKYQSKIKSSYTRAGVPPGAHHVQERPSVDLNGFQAQQTMTRDFVLRFLFDLQQEGYLTDAAAH